MGIEKAFQKIGKTGRKTDYVISIKPDINPT